MPKYRVTVTADATVSTYIDVEADTPDAARLAARNEAYENGFDYKWTLDDGSENTRGAYIADPYDELEVLDA